MFDSSPSKNSIFVFSGAGSNRHALVAALAESARRSLRADQVFVLRIGDAPDTEATAAGIGAPPARLTLNGCLIRFATADQASRLFASSPDRVLLAEIAADEGDVVIAPGMLPFTRVVQGKAWHSCGPLARPANDGTPRVWCSLVSPGSEPGSLIFEHIALEYDHEAAAREAEINGFLADSLERLSGRWRSVEMLPKDEAKAGGLPLSPEPIYFGRGVKDVSWPALNRSAPIAPEKFRDPKRTASGETRARVELEALRTLWINTGTLCNLACTNCYIESTPRNDRLAYISAAEARAYLDEIERDNLPTREIGFTGGEPFLNPQIIEMMEDALSRGFHVMMLTNAMKPMRRFERNLLSLNERYGDRLTMRVSIDHYTQRLHEMERGPGSWRPTIDGLQWLARNGFKLNVAGRMHSGESEAAVRDGFARLFIDIGVDVDAEDSIALVLFPEMDESADVPEITEACWGILGKSPRDVMCATSRMVVKRKGAERASVQACTLLAYDERFEAGRTLREASGPVALNHPHCAKFCVLGGAACSR
ncbi:MAG: radical SAM protein [Beijerinckiaceae bacterium]